MYSVTQTAQELWPRITDIEIKLLNDIFQNVMVQKAIQIMEDARIDSQYASIPFKAIKQRVGNMAGGGKINGLLYDCWAVNDLNGKHKNCVVTARNEEGARYEMNKFLTGCKLEPTQYTLFFGADAQMKMNQYRYSILNFK